MDRLVTDRALGRLCVSMGWADRETDMGQLSKESLIVRAFRATDQPLIKGSKGPPLLPRYPCRTIRVTCTTIGLGTVGSLIECTGALAFR